MDFALIDNQINLESEASNFISIRKFDEPTTKLPRMLINNNKFYIQNAIISGKIDFFTSNTSINTIFPIVNYNLSDNICVVAITVNLTIEVLVYAPSQKTLIEYQNLTYEDLVSKERNNIAREYYEAFIENGRVLEHKVKSILSLLLSEHIIDEIAISDENPKIKMYDNIDLYADNITEYRLKYINRRTNRIELAFRPTYIKMLGANVSAGLVSNDPYIKLENLPSAANFPLNMISCYWIDIPSQKRSEVSIYIADKKYEYNTYKEYLESNVKKYASVVDNIATQFQREAGIWIDKAYIESVLKKLNPELVVPSMDIIRDTMDNPSDPIEPLRYKYKAFMEPSEFEEKLYISIEDNIGKRYKYKLTENVLSDLTRIGNKLEYTNDDGTLVRKQSVADFNVNANTAIIRRETLIDFGKIPELLGYIYEDMEYLGTDMLPVPNIEVDFYLSALSKLEISMYNGTNYMQDIDKFGMSPKFNSIADDAMDRIPGTTYAVVKYVNSKGEVLKENKIANLFPGTSYIPEIIPIISDQNGKEWICVNTHFPSIILNMVAEYNVIEIKYEERYSKVNITFLNRDGKKIRDDLIEKVQVGSVYDVQNKASCIDEKGEEWGLINSRPQKLVIKDDENKNQLILIYDIEKENIIIKYLNHLNESLKEPTIVEYPVGKVYQLNVLKKLTTEDGLGWIYNGENVVNYLVESGKENVIEIKYDEYKVPVTIKYQSSEGITVLNDEVNYIQVGRKFTPSFEKEITDFSLRMWKYKEGEMENYLVHPNENIIKFIYEPKLADVSIQMLNESGNNILSPVKKQCQIGETFMSSYLNDITDNYGKMWMKIEEPKPLIVSQNETENNLIIRYKPLITKLTVKFFDDERNELIPDKIYERQAGTLFKPEIIEKLESSDGRKWCLNKEKVKEYTVKKNIEENIISIFYEKELTDVTLEFLDVYNTILKDHITLKAQIGSVFNEKSFNKIVDNDGAKWMLESTDPKRLIVKNGGNTFKLQYSEVKAIVVVKHVNVKTKKAVLDDIVTKVRLGSIFVPNIREKVFDTNKLLWNFIGDKNISIVAKENEQENIILLEYDEALTKVNVKYQDYYNNKIRDDITYEIQIGKKIEYKNLDKFIDINKIGWIYNETKTSSKTALEGGCEVVNLYNPLKVLVNTKFLNDKNEEIKKNDSEKIQVGRTFTPKYENRIIDASGKLWEAKSNQEKNIKVSEEGNTINIMYLPVLAKVTTKFWGKTGEELREDSEIKAQVGSVYQFANEEILEDRETKKWNFVKIDKPSITIKENEEQNIINVFYEPRMTNVTIKMLDFYGKDLLEPKKQMAQVGDIFTAEVPESYTDTKEKLGWILPKNIDMKIKVDEDEAKNIIEAKYDKHMITVKDRFVDQNNNLIIQDKEKMLQVGATYEPVIKECVKDEAGKEWIYSGQENKFFGNSKISLVVLENAEKNIALLKYKPSLTNVTIKYQDTLGNLIASDEVVKAQIGSEFTPEIKNFIKDANKNKWTFNPNSKSTILVKKDEKENVILLSYEEEKASIVYKYQDEFKNRLRAPKKKLAQIGSVCTPEIDNVIEDDQGRIWEYKSVNVEKIEVKDIEQENVIEVTYIPLLVNVELNLKNRKGDLILKQSCKAQLGSMFKPNIDENIFDADSMMFKFVECKPQELHIKQMPIGSEKEINVFDLTYEAVYSNVSILFQDIDGNKLRDDELIQLQVGTKYTPKFIQYVKDKKGFQWENISGEVETIRVKENVKENIIKMTYELAKSEVIIKYKTIDGAFVKESKHVKQNVGAEYIPEIENIISDAQNRKWMYVSTEPVKLTVGSINNVINMIYQEKKSLVTIRYESVSGKKLRDDTTVSIQEGVNFIPKKNFPIIYNENEIWKYIHFKPSSLLVTDNEKENIIVQVYDNSEEKLSTKTVLKNPFADNISDEIEKMTENDKNNREEFKEEVNDEKVDVFTETNLVELSKSILLEENEKKSIIKLNNINKDIIKILNNFKDNFSFESQNELVQRINEQMVNEKEIIKKEFLHIIGNDKTGKKFMKILEAIVSFDNDYRKLQDRKVILLTDYFINQEVSIVEQVNFICERGKNDKELLIMKEKINQNPKNIDELKDIYIDLLYEKSMLDNYYKTRTKSKDEYFTNDECRNLVGSEVVIMVTNILPKQAFSLMQKNTLNMMQQNELEAIMNLLSSQQKSTLGKMINEIKDNRTRKDMLKKLKILLQ